MSTTLTSPLPVPVVAITVSTVMSVTPFEEQLLMRMRQLPGRRWVVNHAKGTVALLGKDEDCSRTGGQRLVSQEK